MITRIKQLESRIKLLLFLGLILIPLFYILPQAQAQTTDLTTKYNISFPVEQLGGCKNLGECRNFCEDPVNSAACVNFAKSKGFYQEDLVITQKDAVLAKAKGSIGCGSFAECQAFCQIPANFDKCESFAKQNNIIGGRVTAQITSEVSTKAKEVLGCDSASSCASFCSNPTNQAKCSEFAKSVGIKGGEVKSGPGGCGSNETCRAFCSDPVNYNECSRFSGAQNSFKGPGGCNSEDSCKNFCSTNPAQCRVIATDPYSGTGVIDNPQKAAEEYKKYCAASPKNCTNSNADFFTNRDARLEFEKFCSANPTQCGAKTFLNQTEDQRKAEYAQFCKTNPAGCASSQGGYVDPNVYCQKNPSLCPNQARADIRFETVGFDPTKTCNATPNCHWERNGCECSGFGGIRPTGTSAQSCNAPTSGCGQNSYWDFSNCTCKAVVYDLDSQPGSYTNNEGPCKRAGGTWDGSHCQMPGSYNSGGAASSYGAPNASNRPQQEATCKAGGGSCIWNGDVCNCQGYRSPTSGSYSGSSGTTSTYSSAETACRSAGGSWNGSTCNMPNSSSPVNYSSTTMSRESQENGCKACGGTCNWNGDTCQCQCGSSSSSGSSSSGGSTTAPTSAPAPTSAAAPSTPAPTSAPSVQGVSTSRSLLQIILDLLK